MAEVLKDERRVFTVPKIDWTPELMEQMIPEIPYIHDGTHLELYYNLIYNELGYKLPAHLRPVAWVLADKNIDAAMLIISPGAGKSVLTNIAYPTYEIGYDPNVSILGISSGADLMLDFLNTSMSIIEENDIYKLIYPQIEPDLETGWSAARGIFVKRQTTGQVSPSYQVTGYGCYDEQTEVLTKEGWLPWFSVTGEEEFATRHPETHEFQWQKAEELQVYEYDGEMYHLSGISLDLLVTPNHRILINDGHYENGKELVITAEEVFKRAKGSARIPATSIWKGIEIIEKTFGEAEEKRLKYRERKEQIIQKQKEGFSLRKLGKLFGLSCTQVFKITKNKTNYIDVHGFGRDIKMSGDDYCAFMGMYLSEGHTNKAQVCITQFRKSKGWHLYKNLLNKILESDSYYADSNHQFIFNNKALSTFLKQYGRYSQEKFIPEDIMNASSKQQQIFWNYYLMGDGWSTIAAEQKGIATSSRKMADQLQELAQKMGQSASISSKISKERELNGRIIKGGVVHYSVNLLNSFYKTFNRNKQYYKGNIYCITVPNGIIYVRRNGKSIWCGNSKKITGKHAKILIIDDLHDAENCYDKQTEVLTKRGWLLFKDTNKEDEFATRNSITYKFEWQKPIKLIEQDYKGEMYHFCSRGLDLLVTPNHRMLTTHRVSQKNEYFLSAEQLAQKCDRCLPMTSIWEGSEINEIIFTSEKIKKENKIKPKRKDGRQRTGENLICSYCESSFYRSPSHIKKDTFCSKICGDFAKTKTIIMSGDDYCAFMGMYLSEGYCQDTSNVVICQKQKSKGFTPFVELLTKINNGHSPSFDGTQLHISSVILNKYLKQFGYSLDKFIPELIKQATSRQIEIFLKYYTYGDGSWSKNKEEIYTSSIKMADDLQELYQKTGYFASIKTKENTKDIIICGKEVKAENCHDSYTISRHFSKFTHKPKKYVSIQKVEKFAYNDKVYCASVPNQTLYVRRNGYATWCGNSSSTDQIEKIETYYYNTIIGRQEPEGSRMILVGRRWAADDLYGRLNKSGDWFTMTLASIREGIELYYDVRIPAGLACVFNDYQAKTEIEDIKVVYGENSEQPGFYWPGMVAKYKEALINKKNKPSIFETLYQSNPESLGSKIFDLNDFQDYYLPEEISMGRNYEVAANFIGKMNFDMILQSWDTGLTAESRNDPSCCYTIGIKSCGQFHRGEDKDEKNTLDEMPFHYDIYVLDEWYGRLEIGDLEKEAVNYFNSWNPNEVLIENSVAGIPLIQNLSQFSIPVQGVKVQNVSKKSRAINGANAGSAQGWSRSGRIFIPRNTKWANELLKELDDFSGARGKRDDRVDALVQAVNFAIDFGVLNRELPPGWRTEEEINARMQSIMAPNHPFMQIPYMLDNQINPFYGFCGTCKLFDKETSNCKLHKRKVTKLDSCYAYQSMIDAKMSIK